MEAEQRHTQSAPGAPGARSSPAPSSFWKSAAIAVAYAPPIALVLAVFLASSGVNRNLRATLEGMVHGTAEKPFVLRTLVPSTARALSALTRVVVGERAQQFVMRHGKLRVPLAEHFQVPEGLFLEALWVFGLTLLSVVGFTWVMLRFGRAVIGDRALAHLAPLIGLALVPAMLTYGYIYDLPQLFLFSAGLYLMFIGRWTPFCLVLALAMLNKETSVFLVYLFFLSFYRLMERRQFLRLLLTQCAIAATVRGLLVVRFRGNPGVMMEQHWDHQWPALLKGYSLTSIAAVICLCALCAVGWAQKPLLLKMSSTLIFWFLPLFLAAGAPGEYRVFYELVPVVAMLATDSFSRIVGSPEAGKAIRQ